MRHGIAAEQWLDLSTGINPDGWPVPTLPVDVWNRLPEADDGLIEAAREYYGAPQVLPVAGSQAAIQTLPWLRAHSRAAVLAPGYAEHAQAWRRAGHEVDLLPQTDIASNLAQYDVLVLANPNNPTGIDFPVDVLLQWHAQLAARGGWLVVDEAFMDATPAASLAAHGTLSGLIVLRSLGKFFGLAGARVGFVLAEAGLLQQLEEKLGPWTVSGPARTVATMALRDRSWQTQTRIRLARDAQRLRELLRASGLPPTGGTELFQWVLTPQAASMHERLARAGILVRFFAEPASLRFGLPANEAQWQRLQVALATAMDGGSAENAGAVFPPASVAHAEVVA